MEGEEVANRGMLFQITEAADAGQLSKIRRLLAALSDEDYLVEDCDGMNPIHKAASKGRTRCLKALTEFASKNSKFALRFWTNDTTAIELAAKNGHFGALKYISRYYSNRCCMHNVAVAGIRDHRIVRHLIKKFDCFKVLKNYVTLIYTAIETDSLSSLRVIMDRVLASPGKKPWEYEQGYLSPLEYAIQVSCQSWPRYAILDYLRCRGFGLNTQHHCALIRVVIAGGSVNMMKLLVGMGANPHVRDSYVVLLPNEQLVRIYAVPVLVALFHQNYELFRYLLTITDPSMLGLKNCMSPVVCAATMLRLPFLTDLIEAGYAADGLLPFQHEEDTKYPCGTMMLDYFRVFWKYELDEERECIEDILHLLLSNGVRLTKDCCSFPSIRKLISFSKRHSFGVLRSFIVAGVFETQFKLRSRSLFKIRSFLLQSWNRVKRTVEQHREQSLPFRKYLLICEYLGVVTVQERRFAAATVPSLQQMTRFTIRRNVIKKHGTLLPLTSLHPHALYVDYLLCTGPYTLTDL